MTSNEHVMYGFDQEYYVKRHFRRLVAAVRQGDSGVPVWLADAFEFLVENVEAFPHAESYFHPALYEEIVEWMRRPGSPQPRWLADAVELLARYANLFPSVPDEDAYIVEYIYPH